MQRSILAFSLGVEKKKTIVRFLLFHSYRIILSEVNDAYL